MEGTGSGYGSPGLSRPGGSGSANGSGGTAPRPGGPMRPTNVAPNSRASRTMPGFLTDAALGPNVTTLNPSSSMMAMPSSFSPSAPPFRWAQQQPLQSISTTMNMGTTSITSNSNNGDHNLHYQFYPGHGSVRSITPAPVPMTSSAGMMVGGGVAAAAAASAVGRENIRRGGGGGPMGAGATGGVGLMRGESSGGGGGARRGMARSSLGVTPIRYPVVVSSTNPTDPTNPTPTSTHLHHRRYAHTDPLTGRMTAGFSTNQDDDTMYDWIDGESDSDE